MKKEREKIMNLVLIEAKKALLRGDYPCGCIIIKKNKIISKTSSKGITRKDVTAHAETLAIQNASKKLKNRSLKGCILYSNIEPCLMCSLAIIRSEIKEIVYGTEHMEYGNKKSFEILKKNNIGRDVKIISGIKKEESRKLLKDFFQKR